jgi:hypothetical protein
MIITRLASAIRQQNWSQIITEILIVVIGIFLGLQVQALYDGRNAADEEQRVLGYLISDMEQTLEFMDIRIDSYEGQIKLTFKMLDILEKGILNPQDVADFEEAITRLGRGEQLDPYINSFYDQNLNRILDGDMRKLIDDYRGEVRRQDNIMETLKDRTAVARSVTSFITPVQRGLDNEVLVYYDFDQLKNDQKYRAAIISINGFVSAALGRFISTRENSVLMLDALTKYKAGGRVEEIKF